MVPIGELLLCAHFSVCLGLPLIPVVSFCFPEFRPMCRPDKELSGIPEGVSISPWEGASFTSPSPGPLPETSPEEEQIRLVRERIPGGHPSVFPNVWGCRDIDERVVERLHHAGFVRLPECEEVPGARVVSLDGGEQLIGVCRWGGWWLSFDASCSDVKRRLRMLSSVVSSGTESDVRLLLRSFVGDMPSEVANRLLNLGFQAAVQSPGGDCYIPIM